ncbi:alcohol dehydrogenase catalytic domain-containing protein [Herbiconiux sp.]|uniref:alcohol dehydrogenase catalytic domain-containing protein n=1 Tax=Herbiconiux sp. TaxID=1871186 RepID=UPI0025BA61A1|nr:alcohol dehydrogenase catalytic domain-containing protein [Herbiconiux sp.]
MRAIRFDRFGERPVLQEVPDPRPSTRGVVLRVEASGLCRSDVHGWLGHDDGIALPHVPGHEVVGVIDEVGPEVERFRVGQRVTTPFVCACGRCAECASGNGQVCRNQTQPGFTHWGSFAERVALHDADVNLIEVPTGLDAGAAALLGCRFATAYRGLIHQAELARDESLVVVGCGGVGLSAVMIGVAVGARVIAVDVDPVALERALSLGASGVVNSAGRPDDEVVDEIRRLARGGRAGAGHGADGADVSVEALGRESTVRTAIRSLGARGRHVQIGLFADDPRVPLGEVIARELQLFGSHGMPAPAYAGLLELVLTGALKPELLISRRIGLAEVPDALVAMASGAPAAGVTMIDVSR